MTENQDQLMVTIRCITYNHEPYIRQCLEGFVMQKTNFRFEAIVHDDASTDGTAAIIREYAEKYPDIIKPIYETENQYSKHDGSLRRIMDKHTHGKYVALCEGDDYWTDPFKLQKQVDFLEKHPEYSMSHTSIVYYYQYVNRFISSKDIEINSQLNNNGNVLLEDILTRYRIQTLSVVYRRKYIEQLHKEDPFLYTSGYFLMGDTQLWFGLARKGKIHFLPEVTCIYRRNPGSVSNSCNKKVGHRFSLSSAEMRYYISLHYPVSKYFKNKSLERYEKKLILYWTFDKDFKPKFPINIRHYNLKRIQYNIESLLFNFIRKILAQSRKKHQNSI